MCILPLVHIVYSVEDPKHGAPPLQGGGLLHFLVLFFFPVLEWQAFQDPHKLHPPFIAWLPRVDKHLPALHSQAPSSSQSFSEQEEHLERKAPIVPHPAMIYKIYW